MEAAQEAFRSAFEHCSNCLKKLSRTFQSLDARQQRLEGNETIPLIVPILAKIEMQLGQYDILTAADHVSAVQATRIAALEAELATTKQQLSSSLVLALTLTADNDRLEGEVAKARGSFATLTIDNERLKSELAKAREALSQLPPVMIPAAEMTPGLRPLVSSHTYFGIGQLPPTPTSTSTDAETSARTKRQLTSPTKPRDQPKRMRSNKSPSTSFAMTPDDGRQEEMPHLTDQYDAKVMAKKIYDKFDFDGPWTPIDRQVFLTQLEKAYVGEKDFQTRIETIDRHCTGILTAEPPEPRPCLFAEIIGFGPKGPGGPNMTWQNCKYCNGSPQRRCVSAKFAPHVPSPFGPRDSTGKVPYGRARRYNPVESLEVNQLGSSKRWIVTLRISDPQSELAESITLVAI